MKSKHILSRLSNVSLLLVLLVLTGFSVWAASLNRQASIAVQESELYRQITYTLSPSRSRLPSCPSCLCLACSSSSVQE